MSLFQYRALNAAGLPQQGEIEADSIERARELLEQQGFTIQELEPGQILEKIDATASETIPKLPLQVSFRLFSEEASTSRLRNIFKEMSQQVATGTPVEEIISLYEKRLPTHFIALLKVGVTRGNLDVVLGQFSQYARQHADSKRSFWVSLAYPAVLMVATLAIFLFFMLNLIPQFGSIFTDFGTELPSLTLLVLETSNFLIRYSDWIVGIAIVFLGLLIILGSLLRSIDRKFYESLISYIPIVGRIRFYSAFSFYCRQLALLIENDVPLTTAMDMAGNATENAAIIARSERIKQNIQKGMDYGQLLPELKFMPPGMQQAFRWMEDKKSMAQLLRGTAESLTVRAALNANMFRVILEPISMIGIAFLLGTIVLALFLPLMKLLNDLS